MKAGTIIKTESGRVGTIVYHYLDGYGVAWGRHELGPDEGDWPEREAMLREPYPSAEVECVTEWVIEREDAPRLGKLATEGDAYDALRERLADCERPAGKTDEEVGR